MDYIEEEITAQQKRLTESKANRDRYENEIDKIRSYVNMWSTEVLKATLVLDLLVAEQKRKKVQIA